jgi:hypothetical protein
VFGNAASTDSFSGVWRVTVSPDSSAQQAGKQEFGDEVLFEDGKMIAAAVASYGFGESTYELTNEGNTLNATMSTNGESIVWSANMVGGRLSGSVLWTKASGDVYRYTLVGSRFINSDGESNEE